MWTKHRERRGWSSRLNRVCRALGMITLALLLARCGSSAGPQEQAVVQAGSPETNQARGPVEQDHAQADMSLPTIVRGHIIPRFPHATSTLSVVLSVADPLGKPLTLRYRWLVDGHHIFGATGAQLPPGEFVRGQTVSVEVTPVAGERTGPVWEASPVEVGNSPPRVRRVEIQPSPATRRKPLRVVADVADPDGDAVTVSYQWLRNGTPIAGATGATLDPSHYRHLDRIGVQVMATDGEDSMTPFRSHQVDVLPAAPRFVSQVVPTDFQEGRFRYQARAVHPDEEPLRYALSDDAPEGMQIDPMTGLIEWEPEPSQTGTVAFRVIVEDPEGAKVAQPITLTLGRK